MIYRKNILLSPIPAVLGAVGAGASGAGAAGAGAAMTGAEIAGTTVSAIDGLQSLGFGIANLILQRRAYEENRAWQRYMYEDQKRLNDPVYIMQRRREAGLNPYGDFNGSMSTGQPLPVSASGVSDALNGISGSLSRSADKAFSVLSNKLAFENLDLQRKKVKFENMLTQEQIDNLKSSTAYQDLVNEIAESTKDNKIKLSNLEVEKLLSDILLNNVSFQWLPEKYKAEINKLNEDTKSIHYNWTKYMPAMLLLNKALNESNIDLNASYKAVNEANSSMIAAKAEDLTNNRFAMKEIQKQVKNMKPGIAKDFMIAFLAVLENISLSSSLKP